MTASDASAPDPLEAMFPPFGLRITCGALSMCAMRDTDVPPMTAAIQKHGIYDDGRVMPFLTRWPEHLGEHGLSSAQWYWSAYAAWSPRSWRLPLRVDIDGEVVGVQDLVAKEPFPTTRSLTTGSWLLRSQQRREIGTLMRQAVCVFAIDGLGAEEMRSAAWAGNDGSAAVSRRVGYRPNGVVRKVTADGECREENQFRLAGQDVVRPPHPVHARGAAAFRASIGL